MAPQDPDIAAFRDRCKARAAERANLDLAAQRAGFDAEMSAIPMAPACTTEALDLGGVKAERINHPDESASRMLFYLHGGGHVLGSLASHRHLVSHLAVAAGTPAIHVDYRLAPEHPYPAGLDDAVAAYRAVLASGTSPQSIVVGGESAGGNLAAALLLKLRELGLPQPGGLYLLSPWLDMAATGDSYRKLAARDPMLSRDRLLLVAAAYLGGRADDAFTSPNRADLAGLPPMLIQVGADEVLLSDSLTFAANAAMAGIEVKLHVWSEMPHAWPLFHPHLRAGLAAIDEAGHWMRARADQKPGHLFPVPH
jgi:monoterpene epsilon-lactone hydrolase